MTANEMAENLENKVDKLSSYGSPGYEDSEISSVLNTAFWQYIKSFFDSTSNRKNTGFEETDARAQALSSLVKQSNCTVSSNQSNVKTNGKFYDLPTDFMYTLIEEVTIDKLNCVTKENIDATVLFVSSTDYSRWINNSYRKPFYNKFKARVWRMIYSQEIPDTLPSVSATPKRHQLITDGTFNIDTYTVSYLKVPTLIVVDRGTPANQVHCELDVSTHEIITDIAADLLMENVKEQRNRNTFKISDLE
jgi:hypothetical protein